jgi:enamine deaminase RidA (YjgF/YER057c/UK114 family)
MNTQETADHRFERLAAEVGLDPQAEIRIGGHSEVADGASDLLHEVLGDAGRHTRTSVGVYQLPKNAAVEVDLVAAVTPVSR